MMNRMSSLASIEIRDNSPKICEKERNLFHFFPLMRTLMGFEHFFIEVNFSHLIKNTIFSAFLNFNIVIFCKTLIFLVKIN